MKGLKTAPKGVKERLFFFASSNKKCQSGTKKRACLVNSMKTFHSNSWHDKWEDWWNKVTKIEEANGNLLQLCLFLAKAIQNIVILWILQNYLHGDYPQSEKVWINVHVHTYCMFVLLFCLSAACGLSWPLQTLDLWSNSLGFWCILQLHAVAEHGCDECMYLGCIYLSVWTPLLFILTGATMFIQRLPMFFFGGGVIKVTTS